MKTSDTIVKIIPALLKAQKLMGSAKKDTKNPFFKSNYADYGAVLEACKDLLNENGIVILQPHLHHDGKNFVETILAHESGEFISSVTEIVSKDKDNPQAQGSAITYGRRYGLQSLLGMPAEDDDGNMSSGKQQARPAPSQSFTSTPSLVDKIIPGSAGAFNPEPTKEEPKKVSSFRKPTKAAAPVATEVTTPTENGDWS